MSAKKSELLSAWGILWEIAKAIMNAILDRGGSDEDMRRILSDKKLLADLADRIMASSAVKFLVATYKQVVSYDVSVVEAVKAGKYDWANGNINDVNFPSDEIGVREVEFGIFHFDRTTSSDDNIAEMKKAGFHPATAKETLSFGEKNPKLQLEYPIVGLGSVVELDCGRQVVYLFRHGSGREAGLYDCGGGWSGVCRFLGVRI